jgi:hypothetical protein
VIQGLDLSFEFNLPHSQNFLFHSLTIHDPMEIILTNKCNVACGPHSVCVSEPQQVPSTDASLDGIPVLAMNERQRLPIAPHNGTVVMLVIGIEKKLSPMLPLSIFLAQFYKQEIEIIPIQSWELEFAFFTSSLPNQK